jgi:hypothetical protein
MASYKFYEDLVIWLIAQKRHAELDSASPDRTTLNQVQGDKVVFRCAFMQYEYVPLQ